MLIPRMEVKGTTRGRRGKVAANNDRAVGARERAFRLVDESNR